MVKLGPNSRCGPLGGSEPRIAKRGTYAGARADFERAIQLDPDDLRANYQLGLVYAKLGEKDAARKMFDRADELRKRQRDQERVILKLVDAPQP